MPRGVDADPDEVVRVDRPASKVFDDRVIASFDNAPVTLCHPYEVDADSGRDLAVDVVRTPHRDGDHLVADFFFTDRRAVDLIRNRGLQCQRPNSSQSPMPGNTQPPLVEPGVSVAFARAARRRRALVVGGVALAVFALWELFTSFVA